VVGSGDGLGHRVRAVDARGEDLVLVLGGPALVTDAHPGQVHDAVDSVEGARVEGAAGGVPPDLVGRARGATDQAHDLVAARGERGDEGRADQA
jgi:hypothetical protein